MKDGPGPSALTVYVRVAISNAPVTRMGAAVRLARTKVGGLVSGMRNGVPNWRTWSVPAVLGVVALAAVASQVRAQAAPAAQVGSSATFAEQAEAVRAIAVELLAEEDLPGLSIAIGVDGRVVFSEGFGFADLEHRVPVSPLTRMRIGSVSKPVTAAAMAVLYEQGKLDLDAPIQRYVPSVPEKRWPITVRQVAGHIAGIRDRKSVV